MSNLNLTDIKTIQFLLDKKGLKPSKSLGQNFLICQEVVEAAILSMPDKIKNVTELGPGIGALTQGLTGSNFNVKAVERDANMAEILTKALTPKQKSRLKLINGDLKDVDWTWNEPYQIAGNIPYNLSGFIIRRLTLLDPGPSQAVLLVQKEVGQRLTADAPDMSLITLAVKLWGGAARVMNVPRNCFWPAPKVDSSLILLVPHINNPLPTAKREEIMNIAKVFFQNKRKQMGGSLRRSFNLNESSIADICAKIDISPTMRPQELGAKKWEGLTSRLAGVL